MEDAIEKAYWEFDTERKRTGAERDAFKRQMRKLADELERQREAAAIAVNLIDEGAPKAAANSLRRRVFNDGPVPNVVV